MAQFLDQQGHFLNEQTPALTIIQCQQKREFLDGENEVDLTETETENSNKVNNTNNNAVQT